MIRIRPVDKFITKEISVPGSKYVANRVLMLAALAEGISCISNVPENNDILNAITALSNFGIKIIKDGDVLKIFGTGGKINPITEIIDVGESGTLMRFITAFSALSSKKVIISGSKRICERPVNHLIDALAQVGINSDSPTGCPPVMIGGGSIDGGIINVKGNISSQFISGLLLIAPFAKGDLKIKLTSELVSVKYVDMTIDLMEKFGVNVQRDGYSEFFIKEGQKYQTLDFCIPGDWSSASYFLAGAALLKDEITINNMNLNSVQGEAKFYEVLELMGCQVKLGENSITLKSSEKLQSIDKDMGNMPDVVQTLAAIAPFADGPVTITNIEHLRYKECDRIDMTAKELQKLGAKVETTKDSLKIYPSQLSAGRIDTHNDHRMAMSFALPGLKVANIEIRNLEVSAKSFPGYWEKLEEIGVEIDDF